MGNRRAKPLPFSLFRLLDRPDGGVRSLIRRGRVQPGLQPVNLLLEIEYGLDDHLLVRVWHLISNGFRGGNRKKAGLLLRHVAGQCRGIDDTSLGTSGKPLRLQRRHSLGDILQLTDVPGPTVVYQQIYRVVGQSDLTHAVPFREVRGELPEQQVDVPLPVTKRRHQDLDGVEPVVQILPELALAHGIEKVDIRGRYDADIGLLYLRRADLDELAALKDSQKLRLGGQRQLADLVQEQGPAVRFLKIALSRLDGSGKRTLLVTKKFRIYRPFRYRSAVYGKVFVSLSEAVLMDDLWNILLADTALARYKHGEVSRGDGHGRLKGSVKSGIITNDVVFVFKSLQFL